MASQAFQVAASEAPGVQKRGTRKERLELYALYQQATAGDNNTEEPGLLKRKAKKEWAAWNEKKGMSPEAAEELYVRLVEELKSKPDDGGSSSSSSDEE